MKTTSRFTDDTIKTVVVFGDWHEDSDFSVRQLVKTGRTVNPDAYLHVGDFGAWDGTTFLDDVNDVLVSQDKELWFVDGNHEDFRIINNLPTDSRGLGVLRSNIFHIPRGFSWSWGGKVLMGFGGATSTDQARREPGVTWFSDEKITDTDLARALGAGHVDVLITHDTARVPSRGLGRLPVEIEEAAEENRKKIGEVISRNSVSLNIHGHHHKPYVGDFIGCQIIGLGCNEGTLSNNMIEVFLPHM